MQGRVGRPPSTRTPACDSRHDPAPDDESREEAGSSTHQTEDGGEHQKNRNRGLTESDNLESIRYQQSGVGDCDPSTGRRAPWMMRGRSASSAFARMIALPARVIAKTGIVVPACRSAVFAASSRM